MKSKGVSMLHFHFVNAAICNNMKQHINTTRNTLNFAEYCILYKTKNKVVRYIFSKLTDHYFNCNQNISNMVLTPFNH